MSMAFDSNCIFCRIVSGDLPSLKVYESDRVVAFRDIQPAAPVHILVVPRPHIASIHELGKVDADMSHELMAAVGEIAINEQLIEDGYRVVTNTGAWGGQTVAHLHFHILGGRQLGAMG